MSTAEQQIEQIIHRQQDAWNRGDAAGYSQDCDEQMSFTNIVGETAFGRQAFETKHAFIFSHIFKGSRLEMNIQRMHYPAPNTALVDIACTLRDYVSLPPGVPPRPDGILHTCLLEVFVRTDAGWRLVAYHNVDVKV
ncbi:MAG: SgcJ/EcaC family oxidoreductase [Chloroflexota bacterium]